MPDNTGQQNQMSPGAVPVSSDVPNQLPDDGGQAPSLFAQAMQNSVQPSTSDVGGQIPQQGSPPVQQQPTPEQIQQAQDTALANHPDVKRAGLAYKIAETLAGGPRVVTKIDPNTGETTREKVPLTSKQVLLGSLANILGSVGQVSDNLSNRIGGRSPQPIQPLPTQQADAQQAQMADADFERVQQQKLRAAKVMNANLETLRTAYALRHEEDQSLDQVVANHADDLTNWQKAGAVEASKIPSSEMTQRGFDRSKFVAVPDGYAPAYKPNGERVTNSDGVPVSELTYSLIDGTTQTPLTQDKYSQLAKYGLMSSKEGFKLPEGATISSAQLALSNSKLTLIQQTQRELDEVHDATGAKPVNLATAIKSDPKVLSAIEQFHNGSATEDDPAKMIAAMAASNNPKTKAAVGTMTNLFGLDNLKAFAARQQTPPDSMDVNKAQQIVSDPRTDKTSPAYKSAAAFLADSQNRTLDTKQKESDITEQTRMDAEDRKQAAKDRSTMGYVEDAAGKTYYVSKYDAEHNPQYSAQSYAEVKPSDLNKDRQVIKPLGDVQMNLNHYRSAANGYDAAVQNGRITPAQASSDKDNLTTIFSAPAVTDAASAHVGAQGFGISVPTLSADLNAGLAKKVNVAYNVLTPEGKSMADNYIRARAAIPAWVKALTNSGRGSKEQLDIELQNLLPPYYNLSDIHNRLDGFQDNLDNQKNTLPQNILGQSIPSPVTRGSQPQQPNQHPQNQQVGPQNGQKPAPEGTIVNTANGQMIKQGGQWVAYQGK